MALVFLCSLLFTLFLERIFESCGVTHTHWVEEEKKDENKEDEKKEDENKEEKKNSAKV